MPELPFDSGIIDRVLAVVAMLVAIRPLLAGSLGSRSHLSWKRSVVLLFGGGSALVGAVGLLALRNVLFGEHFYLPSWLGGTLAFFGGMLGVSTLIAGRGPNGLSEDSALRSATQAVAMVLYVAAPRPTLALLGLTRLLRSALPWTVSEKRGWRVVEGLVLLALCLIPRDESLGGLRVLARELLR
ncbi:MAG TPA: hypothetical protein VK824_08375 [Planctomycetota bacterium]|nr:hypothetical protein [Planctomycetota bacterium]